MSEKRKAEIPIRKDVRGEVIRRDKVCQARDLVWEVACGGPLDVDEIVPRGRGGDYLDPANCQLLCRNHHRWKHEHPLRATALGFLKSREIITDIEPDELA